MKKIIILLFFVFASCAVVRGQELISDEPFQKLIGFLNEENWQESAKLSKELLLKIPVNRQDDDAPAIVRYMHIISEAGLMYMGKATKDEALKNVAGFVGHTIFLPSRYTSLKYGLNRIVSSDNKTDTLASSCTNKKGTDLYTSESIVPAHPISIDEFKSYDGKLFRIGGVLKSISVWGNMMPHFNILIDKALLEPGDKQ